MDISHAAQTFAALAHPHRLNAFRLLMAAGPQGLAAGKVAARLDAPPSTMSTHLAQLERSGLLRSWRERQQVIYAIDLDGTRELVGYLVDDCCAASPDLCGPEGMMASGDGDRSKRVRREGTLR